MDGAPAPQPSLPSGPTPSTYAVDEPAIVRRNRKLLQQPAMLEFLLNYIQGSLDARQGPPFNLWAELSQASYTKGQKVEPSSLHAPISFNVNGQEGIRLPDILSGCAQLDGREDPCPLSSTSTKVHIRAQPRMVHPETQKLVIEVGNHGWAAKRAIPGEIAIERRTIAQHIATTMQECFDVVATKRMRFLDNEELARQWKLENGIVVTFDDLILVELRQVSKGTWQPVFAYEDVFHFDDLWRATW